MLLLLACVEPSEKPDSDVPADTATDTDDTDTDDTGPGDTDTDDTDTDDTGPGDTDTDVVDPCATETPICDAAGCTLSFDLATVAVGGAISIDGADPEYRGYEVVFADRSATGSKWGLPVPVDGVREGGHEDERRYRIEASGGTWSGRVPPGRYDVSIAYFYGSTASSSYDTPMELLPVGEVDVTGDLALDVAATRYAVDLSMTVGDTAIEDNQGGTEWLLTLVEATTGARRIVTDEDSIELRLPAGTWSASLYVHEQSVGVALGTWDLGTFEVTGDGPVALAADAVTVGGAASWGGIPLQNGEHEIAWVFTLVDIATGAEFEQWVPGGSTWSGRVPPGVYDVDLGGGYPSMRTRVHEAVDLTRDATLDVEVEVHRITGTASMNGVGAGSLSYATVNFYDRRTASITTVDAYDGTWSADLPEGVYDVWIRYYPGEDSLYVPVLFDYVVSADATLPVDGVDYAVSGTVTYAQDAPPDYDGSRDMGLHFYNEEAGLIPGVNFAYGEPYAMRLPPGTYEVYVSWLDPDPEHYPWVKLADRLVVTADATADFVLDARWVDVAVSLDGAPVGAGDLWLAWNDPPRTYYNEQFDFSGGATRLLLAAGRYQFWTKLAPLREAGTEDHFAPMGDCFVVE